MIKINYFKLTAGYHSYLDKFLNAVPGFMKEKACSFHTTEDRLRTVIGKLILKKMLMEEGYPYTILEQVQQDKYGRPFIDNIIDFNITHSGDYILCVVSRDTKLGVDIEKIRRVDIDDFNIGLKAEELSEIKNHESPVEHFFSIWTQKEAASKANGKGLETLLTDMTLKNNTAICENEEWTLAKLNIDQEYMSYVAFKGINELIQVKLELGDLSDIV